MNRKQLAILILIFVLGAVLRIGFFQLNEYNIDASRGDESWSKINIAMRWLYSSELVPDLNFGPLHTYLIATLYLFNKEHVVISARLVSLVLGILFIFVYFSLLKESFDIDAALFGTFLVAIYPLHICLSSVSLAEVPACFLLFSSLYFLYRFMHYQKMSYLILSAVCLNLSCMLRYECWIFVFLFNLILLFRYKFSRSTCIFLVLSCIFPITCVILSYRATGNPVEFIEVSSRITQIGMQQFGIIDRISGFLMTMAKGLSLFIFICCLSGFFLSIKRKRGSVFILLFLSVFSIYSLRAISGTFSYIIYRYTLLLGLLFIPFGSLSFLYLLRTKFLNRKMKITLTVILLTLVCFFSMSTLRSFDENTKISESTLDVIFWLKANMKEEDKVLLESGVYHPFIVINSNLQSSQLAAYEHYDFLRNRESINESIRNSDYMLICKEDGEFKSLMPGLETRYKAGRVFENDDWAIFKFNKK